MPESPRNPDSPRNPGWKPRAERFQGRQDATLVSGLFLQNSRERITSGENQLEGRFLQVLGTGLIGYGSIISGDLKTTIAGALVISAGRISQKYFK